MCFNIPLFSFFSFFLCCFLYCLPFIGELKIINIVGYTLLRLDLHLSLPAASALEQRRRRRRDVRDGIQRAERRHYNRGAMLMCSRDAEIDRPSVLQSRPLAS